MGRSVKIPLSDGSGTIDLKHLYRDKDRHGNERYYYRRGSRKRRLRENPGTPDFLDEYRKAKAGLESIKEATPAAPKTLRWLIEQYYKSVSFMGLSTSTRTVRRRVLDHLCESLQHGRPRANLPFTQMERRHVVAIRDEKAATPEAAKNLVKFIRHVFNWAIEAGHVDINPALSIKALPYVSAGHYTWTSAEIEQYCAFFPLGTKERLALELLLLTGVRVSDAVKLGKQMEHNGWLYFTETKGEGRYKKDREIPILPRLRRAIDATPLSNFTYLITAYDKPFTPKGFSNWFKKQCVKAGLPHCSAHGLRKAGAAIAAEHGATTLELMAIYGWLNLAEAERYTRKADRRKLVAGAIAKIDPLFDPMASGGSKPSHKALK